MELMIVFKIIICAEFIIRQIMATGIQPVQLFGELCLL